MTAAVAGLLGEAQAAAGGRTRLDLHAWIERGRPYSALVHLARSLGRSEREVATEISLISPRAFARRRGLALLPAAESDRLYRVARAVAQAVDVFEDDANAAAWLKRPSLALAALEVLVHVQDPRAVPALVAVAVELDEALVEDVPMEAPPAGWDRRPPGPEDQAMGRRWFDSRRSLARSVPSIIVPSERIVLLNPRHPELTSLRVGAARPFSFDSRLR